MKKIRYCEKCKEYTLKNECIKCGEKSILKKPQKYSLEDPKAKYRREIKKEILKERGLL